MILTWNKKLNAYSFDTNINQCSKNCELMQNGLKPYCISLKERFKNYIKWHNKLNKNEKLLKSANFEPIMNKEIKEIYLQTRDKTVYIRLYSFGDLSCVEDLIKWCNIARKNPNVEFWLSTRQDSILFEYFNAEKINSAQKKPKNLTIRYSLPLIEGMDFMIKNFDKFNIVYSTITDDKNQANCKKSKLNSSCGKCSDCWNPSIKIIKYFNHGNMLNKLTEYLRFFN